MENVCTKSEREPSIGYIILSVITGACFGLGTSNWGIGVGSFLVMSILVSIYQRLIWIQEDILSKP